MGGSGGGGYYNGGASTDSMPEKVRGAEQDAQNAQFESNVNTFLSDELKSYNDRETDTINDILDTIKDDLGDKIEGTLNLLFGGSIAKHTYIDGLSDVDALVLVDKSDLADKSPVELRIFLAKELRERYGEDAVKVGDLAVTVDVKGHSIQMLPALRTETAFKISKANGKEWSLIRPQKFANILTTVNKSMNGTVVPLIKLAKSIISNLPEKKQLTGYHVESLAVKIFRNYEGPKTHKAMLKHFFDQASEHVKSPIKDSTGQSVNVDDYLGKSNSVERRTISHDLGRIARKMNNADGAQSLQRWQEIVGES